MSARTKAATLLEGDIATIRAALRAGGIGPVELTRASLEAIEARSDLNAVVEVRSQALDEAERASDGALGGIPVVVKDCFADAGRAPTLGSRAPARWLSGTAEVLRRLRAAGAVIVAYSNLHEWMVGMTSLVSAFGDVGNPVDGRLIAGGSSGGSAAALAAGIAPLALGSDAGGSIRTPSACCGVVGLKPTWGLVPTDGFADHGSPIDHIGPMARSVSDTITLLEVLIGRKVTLPAVGELRVGVARSFFLENVDPDVAGAVDRALARLEPRVAGVEEIQIEGGEDAPGAVAAFLLRDVARMLAADRDEWQDVVQPETALVLGIGAAMTDDDRAHAEEVRRRLRRRWDEAFEKVDVIVTPTLPGRIAARAEPTIVLPSGASSAELAYLAWNGPMNLGGVPCLSLPCGQLPDGQGFNLSLTAARGHDGAALATGLLLE